MSVPFSVTFNSIGSVTYTGSPQTIYVTSSNPLGATFSQVYPGPRTANNVGESVTLLVSGTGRFAGSSYTGVIQIVPSGGGGGGDQTLDSVIVKGNYQASNSVSFSNTVTFANAIVTGNLTVDGTLTAVSKQVSAVDVPILTIGSNVSAIGPSANVGVVLGVYDDAANVMAVFSPFSNTLNVGWTTGRNDLTSPIPDPTRSLTVDVFGNVVATNLQATCPTGLLDPKLLVGPPPIVSFGTPLQSSTDIVIPWTIPTQIQTGFYPEPLPLLSKMNFSGIVTLESAQMVQRRSNTFIFSTSGTPGIQDIVVDGVAYNNAYVQVVNPLTFTFGPLTAWYSNYSSGNNKNTITVAGFLTAGVPSEPLTKSSSVSFNPAILPSSGGFTASFEYDAPAIQDILSPLDFPGIDSYQFSFSASEQSNASVNRTDTRGPSYFPYVTATQTSVVQKLYPETTYTVSISAKNTVNPGFGLPNTYTFTTGILPMKTLASPQLDFSSQMYASKAYRTSDLTQLDYPLVKGSLSRIQSDYIYVSVMNSPSDRGSLKSPTTVLTALTTTPSGPTLNLYNFAGTDDLTSSAGGITLAKVIDGDDYQGSGYAGYYKSCYANVVTNLVENLTSSQTLTINRNGTPYLSNTYYFQTLVGLPNTSIASLNLTEKNVVTRFITGVNVVVANSTFDASMTGVTNTGASFIPETPIVFTYKTQTFSGRRATDPVTVTVDVGSTDYSNTISLSCNVSNMNGGVNVTPALSNVLIDAVSSIRLDSLGTGKIGDLRWLSGVSKITNSLSTSPAVPYDHREDIVAVYSNALQMVNGSFTTAIPTINYSTWGFPRNTVDYRGISATGYRFATFSWFAPPSTVLFDDGSGYQSFAFDGLKLNGTPAGIFRNITDGLSVGSATGPELYFAFRYIDVSAPVGDPFSTPWLDVFSYADVYQGVNGTNVLKVTSYTYSPPSTPFACYLYCVVGLPMGADVVQFNFLTLN